MKKTTLAAIAALPVLGIGILGVSSASAQGLFGFMRDTRTPTEIAASQSEIFEHESAILGVSINEIKDAWAHGKGMKEIIEEKGLDATAIQARIKAEREAQMKEKIQALVTQGVITQAQADTRIETMKNQPAHGEGRRGGPGFKMGGMSRGMGEKPADTKTTETNITQS